MSSRGVVETETASAQRSNRVRKFRTEELLGTVGLAAYGRWSGVSKLSASRRYQQVGLYPVAYTSFCPTGFPGNGPCSGVWSFLVAQNTGPSTEESLLGVLENGHQAVLRLLPGVQ